MSAPPAETTPLVKCPHKFCERMITQADAAKYGGCFFCRSYGKCQGCGKDVDHFRIQLSENSMWHPRCACYYMLVSEDSDGRGGYWCTKEGSTCFQNVCTGRCTFYKPRYTWDSKKLEHVEIDYTNVEPLPVFDVKKLIASLEPAACDTEWDDETWGHAVTVDHILRALQKAKRKSAQSFMERNTRGESEATFSTIIESEGD